MLNKLHNQDCLETMMAMPDNFIDLVVTSPPYDDLRDYKGYSFEFEKVAKGLFKIIKDGGIVCWQVSDRIKNWARTGTSFRQAVYFMDIGFKLVDTIIYHHKGGYSNRCKFYSTRHDYVFVLSKGKPKTVNLIKDVKNKSAGQRTKYPASMARRGKDGGPNRKQNERWATTPRYRVRDNIWTYQAGGRAKDNLASKHPAVMNQQLAKDLVYSFSDKGDLVYDPFMGSGTTALAAIELGRRWIGSEISKEYCDLANARINELTKQQRLI